MAVTIGRAIDEFLTSDEILKLAKTTQNNKKQAVRTLLRVTGPHLGAGSLNRVHVDRALAVLRFRDPELGDVPGNRRNAEDSLNVYRGGLRQFVAFLHSAGYLSALVQPTGHLKSAKTREDSGERRRPLSTEAVFHLLEIAGARHPRDRAMVAIALFSGMRESELRLLRWSDIHWDDGEIRFYRPKQRGWHTAMFNPMLEEELRRWRACPLWPVHPPRPDWYVLPARHQGKLKGEYGVPRKQKLSPSWPIVPTRRATNMLATLKLLLEAIGIQELAGKGMHTLRRTFAALFYEATGDIRYVQEALGHASQSTTEIYMDHRAQRERNRTAARSWDLKPRQEDNVVELATRRAR